jgi:hypothetical protein
VSPPRCPSGVDAAIAAAQKAGERRLAIGMATVYDEVEALGGLEPPADAGELCGPFCGCDTCIVREVLDAAWPHILATGDEMVVELGRLREELERLGR